MPKVYIYGIRFYDTKYLYTQPSSEAYDAALAKKVGINKTNTELSKIKEDMSKYVDVSALAFLDASSLGFGNKRVMRFELGIGGKDVNDKLAFVEKFFGKEIKINDVLGVGDYVDTTSISKGKGVGRSDQAIRSSKECQEGDRKDKAPGSSRSMASCKGYVHSPTLRSYGI